MKKSVCCILLVIFLLPVISSCSTVTILNSTDAKEKMESLGYSVKVEVQYGEILEIYKIDQVTILTADKDDDFIQVYYFTNKEDTETFYEDRVRSLTRSVEVAKKNKYSIYRGTQKAVDDFLG